MKDLIRNDDVFLVATLEYDKSRYYCKWCGKKRDVKFQCKHVIYYDEAKGVLIAVGKEVSDSPKEKQGSRTLYGVD